MNIVLAAVHGLSGLFRAVSAVEPSLCRPLRTPLSPSLTGHLASVDVKQHGDSHGLHGQYVVLRSLGLEAGTTQVSFIHLTGHL